MKKIIVWAMLLALAVSMLAGCANTKPFETSAPTTAPETQAPTEPESGLADAVAYVKTIYKNAAEITAKDYEVISVVPWAPRASRSPGLWMWPKMLLLWLPARTA